MRERDRKRYAQNKSDRKVCNRIEVSNTITKVAFGNSKKVEKLFHMFFQNHKGK